MNCWLYLSLSNLDTQTFLEADYFAGHFDSLLHFCSLKFKHIIQSFVKTEWMKNIYICPEWSYSWVQKSDI